MNAAKHRELDPSVLNDRSRRLRSNADDVPRRRDRREDDRDRRRPRDGRRRERVGNVAMRNSDLAGHPGRPVLSGIELLLRLLEEADGLAVLGDGGVEEDAGAFLEGAGEMEGLGALASRALDWER